MYVLMLSIGTCSFQICLTAFPLRLLTVALLP